MKTSGDYYSYLETTSNISEVDCHLVGVLGLSVDDRLEDK